jgi:hypothetical protein
MNPASMRVGVGKSKMTSPFGPAFQNQGNRPVIDQKNIHHGLKSSCFNPDLILPDPVDKNFV